MRLSPRKMKNVNKNKKRILKRPEIYLRAPFKDYNKNCGSKKKLYLALQALQFTVVKSMMLCSFSWPN